MSWFIMYLGFVRGESQGEGGGEGRPQTPPRTHFRPKWSHLRSTSLDTHGSLRSLKRSRTVANEMPRGGDEETTLQCPVPTPPPTLTDELLQHRARVPRRSAAWDSRFLLLQINWPWLQHFGSVLGGGG